MLKLLLTNSTGTWDITPLVPAVRWSGDYQQAARTLDLSVLSSPSDPSLPRVDCPLGAGVQLLVNGDPLFYGFIITRTASTEGNTLELTCFDRGFYLKRNKANYKFTMQTPEAISTQLAADFGIPVGYLAETGVQVTRNFLTGSSLYDIIATAYNLASKTTGKAYHIGFRAGLLFVTVKEPDARTLIIQGGSNLIAAKTTESIDSLVSAVQVYDKDDNLVRTLEDASRLKLYGRLQEIVKQTAEDDKAAEAQKLLDDGGVSQRITVDCLGNVANVTGGTVVVQEPHTGLHGLFFIDSDVHEWKRGQYYNKLVLNYKALMDEKEVGALPNATGKVTGGAGSGGGSSGTEGGSWSSYINKPKSNSWDWFSQAMDAIDQAFESMK